MINDIPAKLFTTVEFPHPIGIVIASDAEISKGVVIYQNVTIGRKEMDKDDGIPHIGKNVMIYSGAVIVGGISIGKNSIVGANAIVTKDVPANSIVVGVNKYRNKDD